MRKKTRIKKWLYWLKERTDLKLVQRLIRKRSDRERRLSRRSEAELWGLSEVNMNKNRNHAGKKEILTKMGMTSRSQNGRERARNWFQTIRMLRA